MTGRQLCPAFVAVSAAVAACAGQGATLGGDAEGLPLWVLDSAPSLQIGGPVQGGPEGLVAVAGVTVSRDGSIVVADRGQSAVFVFDSSGRFVRRLIRDGDGPAELRYPGSPDRLAGDTIAVLDQPQARVAIFDAALEHVVTRRPDLFRGDSAWAQPVRMVSTSAAVSVLFRPPGLGDAAAGRSPVVLGLVGDGGRFDTLAVGPGQETVEVAGRLRGEILFGARTVWAVGPGPLLWIGTSDTASVRALDMGGKLVRQVQWTAPGDPVTGADREHESNDAVARWMDYPEIKRTGAEFRRTLEAGLRARPAAAEMPRFTGIVPTDDGGAWILRSPRRWEAESEHLVADSTGAVVARIRAPTRFTPMVIKGRWVLGVTLDGDDVPTVVRYRYGPR